MKRQLTPLSNLVDNGIQGTQKDSLKKAVVVEPNFKVGRQKKKKNLLSPFQVLSFYGLLKYFASLCKKKQTI